MLDESTRNWLVQMEVEALETGATSIDEVADREVSDEERKAFDRGLKFLKEFRDKVGPEEFDKITIDVGYDY